MSARIEAASIDRAAALSLSALWQGLGPSRAVASTCRPRSWSREGCPDRSTSHERSGHKCFGGEL